MAAAKPNNPRRSNRLRNLDTSEPQPPSPPAPTPTPSSKLPPTWTQTLTPESLPPTNTPTQFIIPATGTPFSPSPFVGSASVSDSAFASVSTDQRCVELFDWWVVKVGGGNKRIAIAGFFTRKRAARLFTSAPIKKRHDAYTLETSDGITVLIHGMVNFSRMQDNGFPYEVCNRFMIGFPLNWENYTDDYVKDVATCKASPLKSSSVDGPLNDSAGCSGSASQIYLDKFRLANLFTLFQFALMGNIVNSATKAASNCIVSASMQKSSAMPNQISEPPADCNRDYQGFCSSKTPAPSVYSQGMVNERTDSAAVNASEAIHDGLQHPFQPVQPVETNSGTQPEKDTEININISNNSASEKNNTNVINSVFPDGSKAGQMPLLESSNKVSAVLALKAQRLPHIQNFDESANIASCKMFDGKECGVFTFGAANYSLDNDSSVLPRMDGAPESASDLDDKRLSTSPLRKEGYRKGTAHESLKVTASKEELSSPILASQDHVIVPVEEQACGDEVLHSPRRRKHKKRSYAGESPITRTKAKKLSIATPEELKCRRTRSGRLVVPRLDYGRQRIIYDADGKITGIIGVDLVGSSQTGCKP